MLGFDGLSDQDAAFPQWARLLRPSGSDVPQDIEAKRLLLPGQVANGSKEAKEWCLQTSEKVGIPLANS